MDGEPWSDMSDHIQGLLVVFRAALFVSFLSVISSKLPKPLREATGAGPHFSGPVQFPFCDSPRQRCQRPPEPSRTRCPLPCPVFVIIYLRFVSSRHRETRAFQRQLQEMFMGAPEVRGLPCWSSKMHWPHGAQIGIIQSMMETNQPRRIH